MLRKILQTAAIVLCLICTACSYRVDFVLVNESNETVEVEYTLSVNGYVPPAQPFVSLPDHLSPFKTSLQKWEGGARENDWRESIPGQFHFDPETGRVRLKLGPREVVRIAELNDSILFRDGYRRFPVTRLEIRGESGRVVYEGARVFVQFAQKSYSNRFISYQSLPPSD